jgi:hypothetical protein
MAERGKAKYAYISAGSNTAVKSSPGTLYSITVSAGNGATVVVDDSAGGIGTTPNYNTDPTSTLIGRFGLFAATPTTLMFDGIGFNTALHVAATSNARLTVEYE